MNRLQHEVHRLYMPQAPGGRHVPPDDACLIDAGGQVRAMVMELAKPADWQALSTVWNGVQLDLELPAPAIAVSGTDGYQLWFSLAVPLPAVQALAFLEALRLRYLNDIQPHRLSLWPTVAASSALPVQHAKLVPAAQAPGGLWSAFVAPDLAAVFAAEPWLDLPPTPEAQARVLSPLKSIQVADLERALERLWPTAPSTASRSASDAAEVAEVAGAGPGRMNTRPLPAGLAADPKRFLLDVMSDDTIALGLRIEAAKALLPYFEQAPRQ
jgi:hypothetical protein